MDTTFDLKGVIVSLIILGLSVALFIWSFLDTIWWYIVCLFIEEGTLETCRFTSLKATEVLFLIISVFLIVVFIKKTVGHLRSRA
jgi:uncharacterized membrane protein